LTLLDGFARLRALAPELDARLVVAGGATLFDYRHEVARFRARVAMLGLEPAVRILGTLTDERIQRLYRAADAFAFPSTKEGFGLAALEALASGLPVVASDLDALTTFLEDGRSAVLVPVGDRDALGAALARVGRDESIRRRLCANGLLVAADYGWDAAAVAHERAYGTLLAGRLSGVAVAGHV
jgi:glycosyltransferase involved in cell wall biosynthesis